MEDKVLVAYASKYGSTKEVAEVVAGVLRESGLTADLQPMSKVRDLEPYGAVVLGAPIYLGSWHADFRKFLAKHQEGLIRRRPVIFTLGPTHSDPAEWQGVRIQLEKELANYSWLNPLATELFGGKYDPAKLRIPDSLLSALPASPLHGMPASDARDWQAIRTWAQKMAEQLRFVESKQETI
ncbi:MAG: flavodoxin domain-containing protein [Anaerolineales bacterium]